MKQKKQSNKFIRGLVLGSLWKIEQEGCANRELQRQIQSEAMAVALADAKNQNTALMAQINLSTQLAQSQAMQNAYLVSALKPTTTTG